MSSTASIQDVSTLLQQMPGIIMATNSQHDWIATNDATAAVVGYKSAQDILGTNIANINCPAAESADLFKKQNEEVLKSRQELTLLDIHTYANNELKLFITHKKVYDYSEHESGVLANALEMNFNNMQNLIKLLLVSDKKYYDCSKKRYERSYQFNNYSSDELTPREQDVMFFLVRGKTMADIAKMLFISIRTVETHIDNIKNKFGCYRKSDLIEIGIDKGYLNLIPKSLMESNISTVF